MTKPDKQRIALLLSLVFAGNPIFCFGQPANPSSLPELIPYRKGGKWGFCDKNKTMIVKVRYDQVWLFTEGLAGVRLNDKWGFIDKAGRPHFSESSGFAFELS